MISLNLWRALRRPPTRNPLFRHVYANAEQPAPWYVGCIQWTGILFFVPIIALAGLIYGFGWSAGIATQLGREREKRTFDLLSLTPPGPLGMSWAAALGYLYQHRTFRNINQTGNLLIRAAVMAFVLATFETFVMATALNTLPVWSVLLLHVLGVLVALIVDHVQSLVAAILSGIVAGHATASRLNGQILAFAIYSGVQLVTYVATLAIVVPLLPLAVESLLGAAFVVLLGLCVFAGSREALIWLLWRWADRLLAPDANEQRVLLGQMPRRQPHRP